MDRDTFLTICRNGGDSTLLVNFMTEEKGMHSNDTQDLITKVMNFPHAELLMSAAFAFCIRYYKAKFNIIELETKNTILYY